MVLSGPGFTIGFTFSANEQSVAFLQPGTYNIQIDDTLEYPRLPPHRDRPGFPETGVPRRRCLAMDGDPPAGHLPLRLRSSRRDDVRTVAGAALRDRDLFSRPGTASAHDTSQEQRTTTSGSANTQQSADDGIVAGAGPRRRRGLGSLRFGAASCLCHSSQTTPSEPSMRGWRSPPDWPADGSFLVSGVSRMSGAAVPSARYEREPVRGLFAGGPVVLQVTYCAPAPWLLS